MGSTGPPWSAAPAHVGTLSALWRPTNNIKTSMCRRRRSRSSTSVVSLQGIKKRNLCVSRPQDKPCVGPTLCSSLSSGWATRGLRTAECPFVGFHYLHKQSFRTSKQQQHHDSTKATECEITASSCYSVLSGAVLSQN